MRRVSAGSVPPEPSARSCSSTMTLSHLLAPASVGQRPTDAPDRGEVIVVVNRLQIRVEHQELRYARRARSTSQKITPISSIRRTCEVSLPPGPNARPGVVSPAPTYETSPRPK